MAKGFFDDSKIDYSKLLDLVAQNKVDKRESRIASDFSQRSQVKARKVRVSKKVLASMVSLGTGLYKSITGHEIWSLKKEGDELFLIRQAPEKEYFKEIGLDK